jgi:hypothetical protein
VPVTEESEKKKSDPDLLEKKEEELPLPSKSEIIREAEGIPEVKPRKGEAYSGKHSPVIEKPTKSFSIKNIISEERKAAENDLRSASESEVREENGDAFKEFNAANFEKTWSEFTSHIKGDGTRIISMFKSIKTEVENDHIIRLHLTNAAQKDLFVHNYRQKLLGFLNKRFLMKDIDIETVVDPTETNELLYSDEQKYNYLVSKYPELKDFRKAFNLDIT